MNIKILRPLHLKFQTKYLIHVRPLHPDDQGIFVRMKTTSPGFIRMKMPSQMVKVGQPVQCMINLNQCSTNISQHVKVGKRESELDLQFCSIFVK